MTPILVQEVTDVQDVEAQLDGVDLTSYLETILLCEVYVEMMLESKVVCKSLVVLTTVISQVRIVCDPSLQHLTLSFFCQYTIKVLAEYLGSEVVVDLLGRLLELHLVNLCVCRDVEKVVAIRSILVDVSIICLLYTSDAADD